MVVVHVDSCVAALNNANLALNTRLKKHHCSNS